MKQIMVKNLTTYSMKDIYEYLAGYTSKLRQKIIIKREHGKYYDTLYIKDK